MTEETMTLEAIVLSIGLPVLCICLLTATIRLVRGPHILDRVLALDFMIVTGVGMLGFYAVATDQPAYLDVAVVVALLSFLGTIGFAYYVELRGNQRENLEKSSTPDAEFAR